MHWREPVGANVSSSRREWRAAMTTAPSTSSASFQHNCAHKLPGLCLPVPFPTKHTLCAQEGCITESMACETTRLGDVSSEEAATQTHKELPLGSDAQAVVAETAVHELGRN